MSYEQAPLVEIKNNTIRVKHPDIEYNPHSYLAATVSAAGTTLTVRDNAGFLSGFTNNWRVLIGSYGDERTEIKAITADPTAGTSLQVAAVTFSHPIDTPITQIIWDQVEVYGNTSNTTVGAVLLATINISVDEEFSQYIDTSGVAYTYYFARYRNSSIPRTSSYSDGVSSLGASANSRASIKERALARSGISLDYPLADGEAITEGYLNSEIKNCELDIQQRSMRWNFLFTNNFLSPISLSQGQRTYSMPSTILDANSNRSIESVRVDWGVPLQYLYPKEYNERTRGVTYSTLSTALGVGDPSVVLTSSRSFDDTGTITIGSTNLTYTANNRSTGTLTLSAVSTISAAINTEVFQNITTGMPTYYTVINGNLLLYPIPDTLLNGHGMQIEFYRTIIPMDSDGDSTLVPFYNVFDIWLLWRIAERRKLFDESSKWEAEYERRMEQALQDNVTATELKFYPGLSEPQIQDYTRGRIVTTPTN